MGKVFFLLVAVIGFFIVFSNSESYAQSCTGSASCTEVRTVCSNSFGDVCSFGSPGCSCSSVCGPGTQTVYCGFVGNSCNPFYACDELCGNLTYVSCSYDPGGGGTVNECSGNSCGTNYQCCAGSNGTYCSNYCQACNGANICAAPTAVPTATPTPLPLCPENQSGANTIQCQGGSGCVQDWNPLSGYRCASGGTCCQKETPSACPGLPGNGSQNSCLNGSSCPVGTTPYGSLTNNACGTGRVCCNTAPANACPMACATATAPGGGGSGSSCTPPGGGTGTWYNEGAYDNWCTYQTSEGNATGNYCWVCVPNGTTPVPSATPNPTATNTPVPTSTPVPGSGYQCCNASASICSTCSTAGSCSNCNVGGSGGWAQCRSCTPSAPTAAPTNTPIPTLPPACNNNGTCQSGLGEACGTCGDCGSCPTTGSISVRAVTVNASGSTSNGAPAGATYSIFGSSGYSTTGRTFSSTNHNVSPANYTVSATQVANYDLEVRGSLSSSYAPGSSYGPFPVTVGSTHNIGFRYSVVLPSCSSLTMNARSGQGGVPAGGSALPGQGINLFANIINDNGDHSTWDWTATCGTFTVDQWDYATWQAPAGGGNCNISYSLNNQNQTACTGSFTVPVPTATPTRTPTPTPAVTYNISGIVFEDTDGDGIRDAGESPYLNGALITRSLTSSGSVISDVSGNYSFTGLAAGAYNVVISTPPGYVITTPISVVTTLGPNRVINFGLRVTSQCEDSIDNDGDTRVDCSQSSCYPDYDMDLVCDPTNGEDPPQGDCSDGIDNDGDGEIDGQDPDCYDGGGDFDPTSPEDPAPVCPLGISASPSGTVNPSAVVNLTASCTDVENPDDNNPPPPYYWEPYTPGDPSTCITTVVPSGTGSQAAWTAPSCPTTTTVCRPRVTVSGPGGEATYTRSITVRAQGQINVYVHDLSDGDTQNTSAPLYDSGPITIGIIPPSSIPSAATTITTSTGQFSFTCLPTPSSSTTYQVNILPPSGYQVTSGSTTQSTTLTASSRTRDVHFYITNFEPWFQTESGDVRMRGILNPIPGGQVGSTDTNSPTVFHSSTNNAKFDGGGTISNRGWVVNSEYGFNDLTENRNGTVAYSFYKSRARQEGIPIEVITSPTFDALEISDNGIYEFTGDLLTINGYQHAEGRRVVLLVNGDVQINSDIEVPVGGLFILAATGDITIASSVGHASPGFNTTESNLDGYYSAEGNIIIEGDMCSSGTPDRRLNVGGVLIANALKPFSSSGGGVVLNQRSLCGDDDSYPTLYVSSRLDFLTALTDFYKVSYTKWREVR